MLRLLSSKEQGCKDFWKSSKPFHVGIHWIFIPRVLFRWVPMCQGFNYFQGCLHQFLLAKLATSSTRVKRARSVQLMLYGEHYTNISLRVFSKTACRCQLQVQGGRVISMAYTQSCTWRWLFYTSKCAMQVFVESNRERKICALGRKRVKEM